jgi:esterase/lipase superfamily enzyme
LCAIKAAVAELTVRDFAAMLRSLKEAGIRKVHVITHSMGIHLLLAAIRSISVQSIFAPPSASSLSNVEDNNDLSGNGTKRAQIGLRLTTVSFLNPDYPVKVFRDEDYPILRGLCQHISIYVDKDDSALYWSEKVGSRLKSLGLLSRPLRKAGLRKTRAGEGGVRTVEEAAQYLDVDLVDSSALQENFHSMRHSAFNVNRVLVEDLRDVIVEGFRARVRTSRLLNEKGNLYHFMTIPPTVNGNVV